VQRTRLEFEGSNSSNPQSEHGLIDLPGGEVELPGRDGLLTLNGRDRDGKNPRGDYSRKIGHT
jgi:hypothetical protein